MADTRGAAWGCDMPASAPFLVDQLIKFRLLRVGASIASWQQETFIIGAGGAGHDVPALTLEELVTTCQHVVEQSSPTSKLVGELRAVARKDDWPSISYLATVTNGRKFLAHLVTGLRTDANFDTLPRLIEEFLEQGGKLEDAFNPNYNPLHIWRKAVLKSTAQTPAQRVLWRRENGPRLVAIPDYIALSLKGGEGGQQWKDKRELMSELRGYPGVGRFMAKNWYSFMGTPLPREADLEYTETWAGSRGLMNFLEGEAPTFLHKNDSQEAAEHFNMKLERVWRLFRSRYRSLLRQEPSVHRRIPSLDVSDKRGRLLGGDPFQFELCELQKICRYAWTRDPRWTRAAARKARGEVAPAEARAAAGA